MSRKARATVFRVAFHALLTAVVAVYLLPLALVVLNSFKTYSEIMTDVTAMPQSWTLDNFRTVFTDMNYPAAFLNTLIITAAGVLGIVVFGSMAGYKLARVKTRYSKAVFFLCIMPMMIPFQSFMITLVKVAVTLHINSSVWGLFVPGLCQRDSHGVGGMRAAGRRKPIPAIYPHHLSYAQGHHSFGRCGQRHVAVERFPAAAIDAWGGQAEQNASACGVFVYGPV